MMTALGNDEGIPRPMRYLPSVHEEQEQEQGRSTHKTSRDSTSVI